MTYRIPIGFTDHMRDELRRYAAKHGASFAGAVVAMVARGLAEVAREEAAVATMRSTQQRRQTFTDEALQIAPIGGLIHDQPAPRLCHKAISETTAAAGTTLVVCNRYDKHKGRCSRFGEKR